MQDEAVHPVVAGLLEEAAVAMFLAYYNFVWRTRDDEHWRTRLPAAMAAGITKSLMRFADLFDAVMGTGGQTIAA